MHRPFMWFCAAFAVGTAFALFSFSLPLAVTVAVLALAALGWSFSRLRVICVLAAGLVCGLSYTAAYHRYITDPVAEVDGRPATLTVTAADYAVQYGSDQRVRVKVHGSDVKCPRDFKTLLYLPSTEQEIQPGDSITVSAEFYLPGDSEGFDRAAYYHSEGYTVLASAAEGLPVTITVPEHRPFTYYPKRFAHALQDVFAQYGTQRQAAFWNALATGDRSGLSVRDTDHLRRAGLSHIIALSGLHVGFLVSMLLFVFGKRMGTVLGIPTLIVFCFMVGFSPSVLRACLMYGILIASFGLRQQYDGLTALAAALLVNLIYLPDLLTSVSLQLSFLAALGMICFTGRIRFMLRLPKKVPRALRKVYDTLMTGMVCTVCATVMTAPVLLYYFGYISVFSIFSNLLALWAVSLLFPLLLLGGIAGIWLSGISGILLIPAGYLTDYIYWVSDTIAEIPYGVLYWESSIDFAAAVVLSLFAVLLLWLASRRTLLVFIPVLLAVVIGVSIWRGVGAADDLHISILSEGRGQAIMVSCGEHAALIDCSSSGHHHAVQDIAQYMDWHGIEKLDYFILTSVDVTHARNACELMETVPVEQVLLPEVNRETNAIYPELMNTLEKGTISYSKMAPETETAVGDASLGLSVLGGVERKLMVRIHSEDQDILVIRALTQKMLLDYTENTQLSAKTLVIAPGFTEDLEKMQELIHRLKPEQLILENGWYSETEYGGVPTRNPYLTGTIDLITVRNMEGG